jgi:DNA-directed RNA polymerase subunit RPC12/RpoP
MYNLTFLGQHTVMAEEEEYMCHICGKTFSHQWRVKRHFNQVHNQVKKAFKCSLCAGRFLSEEARDHHLHHIHAERMARYLCEKCGFTTHTVLKLKYHIRKSHPPTKSDMQRKKEEIRERRKIKREKRFKKRQEFLNERRRLSLLTDCVRCGRRFASSKLLSEHANAHAIPARYVSIETAFKGACQTWAKQFDRPEEIYPVRKVGEGPEARAVEKKVSGRDLRSLLEIERRAIYVLLCRVLQDHKISKFSLIPHIKMVKTTPEGTEVEGIFHLRTRQYTATISSVQRVRSLFNATFTQMRDGAVSRMEDRLFEEVKKSKIRTEILKHTH